MAINSGLRGQFGVEIETTAGTYETPTHFMEFTSEDLKLQKAQVKSQGIRAGRRLPHNWVTGTQTVEGSTSHELTAETVGEIFRACFGGVATTGAGPYVHTFTPGDLPAATVQIGRPGTAGTVHPFSYLGCRVRSWTLNVDPSNTFATLQITWVGEDETTGQALASASFSTFTRFTLRHASFEIAAGSVCVDSVSISGDNGLDVTHQVCVGKAGKPTIREAGMRSYTGTATADFADLTQYDRYRNATEVALELELNAGASAILNITGNVHFTGETPNVSGPEVLKQPIPFEFSSPTSDAAAFTVVLTNSDSTP